MTLFIGQLERGYIDRNFFWRTAGQSYLGWSYSVPNLNSSDRHRALINKRKGLITFYEITAISMLIAAIPIAQALLN